LVLRTILIVVRVLCKLLGKVGNEIIVVIVIGILTLRVR
jgi:hypothetical protein